MTPARTGKNSAAAMDVSLLPKIADVTPSVRRLAPGSLLFRQGDKTFGIFRLVSGQIRLLRVTPDGTEVAMHTVREGELFAEASLFSPRYHCDALTVKASEVLLYPKDAVTQQLATRKEEMWAFAAEMAHRIQGMRTRLEMRHIRSAPARVLQTLRLRCDASGNWVPDGALKQFAQEIDLTHEALYRALAQLEREGSIARDGQAIRLLRKERGRAVR